MTSFVHFAADPESSTDLSWAETRNTILENSYLVLHELKNFSDNVQNRRINSSQVANLKDSFISISQNANPEIIEPVREFLCEAFCLVDILDEILMS